ncbi:MAG: endonuclease Q family protein [Candidatus Pacebacteria bacterium]|nr:endonuclease Q family protein [Candidatus Paceibacterota bacterium]
MRYIADFHIHSKYSRATSQKTDLENLEKWAKTKGISILGTGDFTHPEWLREIKEKLEPVEEGLFKLKGSDGKVKFILTTELSCIYTKNDKVRKIHIMIFSPSIKAIERINTQLSWTSNLKSDGRPILGMDAKDLAKLVFNSSPECLIVPAHIWTPWFSLFGSRSGFDTIEECFEDLAPNIFALETGLSSDPEMNWRLSALDKYTLISNSDSHSPQKLGREANIFEGENINYQIIADGIKKGGKEKSQFNLIKTIEFFPEEGKYHFDGHRNCEVRLSPEERKSHGGICPVCRRPLTVGVLSRVDELADRELGYKPKTAVPFVKIVPLPEIIAEVFGKSSANSKFVDNEYQSLISNFGSEFDILLDVSIEEIKKISPEIAEGIEIVRNQNIKILPGYDGEFGKVSLFEAEEEKKAAQNTLF